MEVTTFINLFTLCFLLTRASSTTAASSSAVTTLRSLGYSRFATKLMSSNSFNATGTILAPSDFAFSIAAAKFDNHRHRFPPRPSTSLFLYHTIDQPLTLQHLHTRAHGDELPTLFHPHCLFISNTANGDLSLTGSRKLIQGVRIRHPNLYVDDNLAVHGIDGVLDPSSASKCSVPNPTANVKLQIERNLLELAARALRKNGYYIVATALTIKSSDLMNLNGLTVLTPSDKTLFSFPNGFRYDFSRYVIPNRLRYADIARLPAGSVINTIDPNKNVVIRYDKGHVTVNGAILESREVYLNRWIVAISVSRTFDDGAGGYGVSSSAPTYSITGENYASVAPSYSGAGGDGVPITAPVHSTTRLGDDKISFAPVAPSFKSNSDDGIPYAAPVNGLKENASPIPSMVPSVSYESGNNNLVEGGGSDGAPIYSAAVLQDHKIALPSLAPSFSNIEAAVSKQVPSSSGPGIENHVTAAPPIAWRFSGDYKVTSPSADRGFLDEVEGGVPPPIAEEYVNKAIVNSDVSDYTVVVTATDQDADSGEE